MKHPNLNPAQREDWGTPAPLWDALHDEFCFTVDAAASPENALLPTYWTAEQSALLQDWQGHMVYINPPFSHGALAAFARKAWEETRQLNTTAVMLCPVKSDQRWWGQWAIRSQIRFLRGRVTFEGAKSAFPVPCALLVFGLDYGPGMVQMEIPR
jgi:site-specific DNA-methyltransferase (adenine-specific)